MTETYTCSRGHRWTPDPRRLRQPNRCPYCGQAPKAQEVPMALPVEEPPEVVVVEMAPVLPKMPSAPAELKLSPAPPPASAPIEQVVTSAPLPGSPLKLGPELPLAIFTSSEPWHPERIGALALYCSDGRWGDAFDEFCHRRLQIPRYDRWAVPGGPAWLVPTDDNRHLVRTAREQLDFLVRIHELERVVLIAHYGCAHYTGAQNTEPDACLPRQREDLRTAARMLREWFPNLQVESYLAMRRNGLLSFHAWD